jgi:hypothetical protein
VPAEFARMTAMVAEPDHGPSLAQVAIGGSRKQEVEITGSEQALAQAIMSSVACIILSAIFTTAMLAR